MKQLPAQARRLRALSRRLDKAADRTERGRGSREEIDRIVTGIRAAQTAIFGEKRRSKPGEGAKAKILAYLQRRVGKIVTGAELAEVSGIQEWARRVRELRVEDGYDIAEVGRSRYCLESAKPEPEKAKQWRVANEIRNRRGSARSRIEAFLEANVGDVVRRDQIDHVARIAEGSRRVRELRDELGWPINSHIDEPELNAGDYRLTSSDPNDRRDPLQRLYPEKLRQKIFERDGYTCHVCGRDRAKAEAAGDSRFYLEVHHTIAVADELATLPKSKRNDPLNLVTLCHADHLKETAKLQKSKRKTRTKS